MEKFAPSSNSTLRELYLAAAKAYKLKKYDDAIKLYQVIRTYYPMHNYIFAALYNEALAHEDKGDHNAAIKLYLEVVQHHAKHTQLALNARFRLAACYGKQKQWQKAFQLYDALLQGISLMKIASMPLPTQERPFSSCVSLIKPNRCYALRSLYTPRKSSHSARSTMPQPWLIITGRGSTTHALQNASSISPKQDERRPR
ncbi:MAG: tetratricopeptide repeat protein [Myxococcales bacterium]|nr:tetratricopeptide repeat protein [Myxococcales bacterium]